MLLNSTRSLLNSFACLLLLLSCTKTVYVDKVVQQPSYPDLEGTAPDTLTATQACIQYYGAYSESVDRWYLKLFEKEGVRYVHEDDEYLGEGQVVILCMQTAISDGAEKDIPVIVGRYSTPSSYSDLQIGQYEFGYDYPYDHPYKGIRYATYGTYLLDLDETAYVPKYASDGGFEVRRLSDGSYEVEGMIVDTGFKKHYFRYSGPLQGVTEWNYYFADNSSLTKDVRLTEAELPVLSLRRTELPFGNYKNIDAVRMYFSASSVEVGPQASYGVEKLSGAGAVAVLEMIVEHGAEKLPEGCYEIAPHVDGGYDGAMLTPFHFKEGMPNRFTNREGSWYFNLSSDGHWTGDYAQVHAGTVQISYAAGKDTPVVHAELVDEDGHKLIIDWK